MTSINNKELITKKLIPLFLILLVLIMSIQTKITIIPDSDNPIQIMQPYKNQNLSLTIKFSIKESKTFLFKNQFIALVLPSTMTSSDLSFNSYSNFTCSLSDNSNNKYTFKAVTASISNINSNNSSTESNHIYCKYTDTYPIIGGSGKSFTLIINLNKVFSTSFIPSYDLLFTSSNTPDKIIYSSYIGLGNTAQFGNYLTNSTRALEITSAEIKPLSGKCSLAINQCSSIYPYNYFEINLSLKINSYLYLNRYLDVIIVLDDEVVGYDEESKVKISDISSTNNSLLILRDWNDTTLTSLGNSRFRLNDFKSDGFENDEHTIRISNGIFAKDSIIKMTNRKLEVYVYWKNSFSIVSYHSIDLFFISQVEIYYNSNFSGLNLNSSTQYNGISHPEFWDLYENSYWPVRFVFTVNNDLPNGGILEIKHNNLNSNSIVNFISSTCDMSDQIVISNSDSSGFSNELGIRYNCIPLNSSETSTVSSFGNIYSSNGSGILVKFDNFKADAYYTITVWMDVVSCTSKTIDEPLNISENDNKGTIPTFGYKIYKNIDLTESGKKRVSESPILASSNNISFFGNCFTNLPYKDSTTSDFSSSFNNFIVYSVTTTKAERDYLLFKEISDWSLIQNTANSKTLDANTSDLRSYINKSSNSIQQGDSLHINFNVMLKSSESVIDKIPMPYYQNDNDLEIYLKPGRIELKLSRGLFTSKLSSVANTNNNEDCYLSWGGIFPNESTSTSTDITNNIQHDLNQTQVNSNYNTISISSSTISKANSNLYETSSTKKTTILDYSSQKQLKIQSTNINSLSLDLKQNDLTGIRYLPNSHLINNSENNFDSSISLFTNCYVFDVIPKTFKSIYTYVDVLFSNLTNSISKTEYYPHRTTRFISFLNSYRGVFNGDDTLSSEWSGFSNNDVGLSDFNSKFSTSSDYYYTSGSFVFNHFAFSNSSKTPICVFEISSSVLGYLSDYNNKNSSIEANSLLIFLYNVNLLPIDFTDSTFEYPVAPTVSNIKTYGFDSSFYLDSRLGKLNSIIADKGASYLNNEISKVYNESHLDNTYYNYRFQLGSLIMITGISNSNNSQITSYYKETIGIPNSSNTDNTNYNNLVIPYFCPTATTTSTFSKVYTKPVISVTLTSISAFNSITQPKKLIVTESTTDSNTTPTILFLNQFFNDYLKFIANLDPADYSSYYKYSNNSLNSFSPASLLLNNYSETTSYENSEIYIHSGNKNSFVSETSCSAFILFMNSKIEVSSPYLNKYPNENNPNYSNFYYADVEFNNVSYTKNYNMYIHNSLFDKILISISNNLNIPVLGNKLYDGSELETKFNENLLNGNKSKLLFYYKNIKRPDLSQISESSNTSASNTGSDSYLNNLMLFNCVSFLSHDNYLINIFTINTEDFFYLDYDPYLIYSISDSTNLITNSINSEFYFSDSDWYVLNPYSSFNLDFNSAISVPENSYFSFEFSNDNDSKVIKPTSSLCALQIADLSGNSYWSNSQSSLFECSISSSGDANSKKYIITCQVKSYVALNQNIRLCCYNITQESLSSSNSLYENNSILSTLIISSPNYIPSTSTSTSPNSSFTQTLYKAQVNYNLTYEADNTITYSSPYLNKTVNADYKALSTIKSIVYSHTSQINSYGKLYLKISLAKRVFNKMLLTLSSDLSSLLIVNSSETIAITPRCVYTYNNNINSSISDIDYFNSSSALKGEALVDSCLLSKNSILENTYDLQLQHKSFIYRCSLTNSNSKEVLIMLWPIKQTSLNTTQNNQYSIEIKESSEESSSTAKTSAFSNISFSFSREPFINSIEELCSISQVIPMSVSDKADYYFNINVNKVVQYAVSEGVIEDLSYNFTTDNGVIVNEITLFLSFGLFNDVYTDGNYSDNSNSSDGNASSYLYTNPGSSISCYDETNQEKIVCEFSDNGILNLKLLTSIKIKNPSTTNSSNSNTNVTLRISGLTNPIIESIKNFACTLNTFYNKTEKRENIITGFGNYSQVAPFCHSIALSNLQGNIRVFSVDSTDFNGLNNSPQDILNSLSIIFTIDRTQNLTTLPLSFSQTPLFIITFPNEFDLENSYYDYYSTNSSSFNSNNLIGLISLKEMEFKDNSIIDKNNSPSISNIKVLGNKIVLYLQDNSRVLFEDYAYWEVKFKNFPNPWREVFSTSKIKITLTNDNCSFLFMSYDNLSSEFGQEIKKSNSSSSSDSCTKFNFSNSNSYCVDYSSKTSTYDSDTFDNYIPYYRGYQYSYFYNSAKQNKYAILVSQLNASDNSNINNREITLLPGRYSKVRFTLINPNTSYSSSFTNIYNNFINQSTTITIKENKNQFKLFETNLNTNLKQTALSYIGVSCNTIIGKNLVYLDNTNKEYFLNISPVVANVINHYGSIFFSNYSFSYSNFSSVITKFSNNANFNKSNSNFDISDINSKSYNSLSEYESYVGFGNVNNNTGSGNTSSSISDEFGLNGISFYNNYSNLFVIWSSGLLVDDLIVSFSRNDSSTTTVGVINISNYNESNNNSNINNEGTTDSNKKVYDVKIPASQLYSVLNIQQTTGTSITNANYYFTLSIKSSSNKDCFNFIGLDNSNTFSISINSITNSLNRLENIKDDINEYFTLSNSALMGDDVKNKVYVTLKPSKELLPTMVFCSLYCNTDNISNEDANEPTTSDLLYSGNTVLNDFIYKQELNDYSTSNFHSYFSFSITNNDGSSDSNNISKLIEVPNLLRNINYDMKCLITTSNDANKIENNTDTKTTISKTLKTKDTASSSNYLTVLEDSYCYQFYFNKEFNVDSFYSKLTKYCQIQVLQYENSISDEKSLFDLLSVHYSEAFYNHGCYTCYSPERNVVEGFEYVKNSCFSELDDLRQFSIDNFNVDLNNMKNVFENGLSLRRLNGNTNTNENDDSIIDMSNFLSYLSKNNDISSNNANYRNLQIVTSIDDIEVDETKEIKYIASLCIRQKSSCPSDGNIKITNFISSLSNALLSNSTVLNDLAEIDTTHEENIQDIVVGYVKTNRISNDYQILRSDLNITNSTLIYGDWENSYSNLIINKIDVRINFLKDYSAICYWMLSPNKTTDTSSDSESNENTDNTTSTTTNDSDYSSSISSISACLENTNKLLNIALSFINKKSFVFDYSDYVKYIKNQSSYQFSEEEKTLLNSLYLNEQCGIYKVDPYHDIYPIYFLDSLFKSIKLSLNFYCHYDIPDFTKLKMSERLNIDNFNYSSLYYNGNTPSSSSTGGVDVDITGDNGNVSAYLKFSVINKIIILFIMIMFMFYN